MTDYDQLLGMLKAAENIEQEIYLLNRKKTRLMREVNACGFDRVAFRELMQIRRKRRVPMPDDHVPALYDGLVDELTMARSYSTLRGEDDDGTSNW